MKATWISEAEGKRVLFITTKNRDYIRNVQETELLRRYAARLDIIASDKKSYPARLVQVYGALLRKNLRDTDLVFAGFAPQLILPFFPRLRKKPVIEDFFISLYDTLVQDRKRFSPGSLPAGILKRLDRKALSLGDKVIVDTRAHADFFVRELGCDPGKTEVLYLQADTSVYHPMPVKKTPGDPFRVLYFGSILPLQGVDVILDAIRLWGEDPDTVFEVIGPLKAGAAPAQSNLTCIPWLSQEELAKHIARADLCLAGHFSAEIEKAKRTIPGKAYIYRAMEKPMILGDTPANHELFTENDSTFFSPVGSAEALKETIRKAREMLYSGKPAKNGIECGSRV